MLRHFLAISVVDAHHHLWNLDQHRYPWLDPEVQSIVGDTSAIRRNYLPKDFAADTAGIQIIGTVHLDGGFDPADPVGETCMADALSRQVGFPNAIVGAVALQKPEAPALLEAHAAASPLLRGVRQILAWHDTPRLCYGVPRDLMQDSLWRQNFARLAPMGLSFDLQIYPHQMAEAAALARAFPDTRIILNQAGMPDGLISSDLSAWRAGLAQLAACPNVSVKISGIGMLKPDWTQDDLNELMQTTLGLFGADRMMFASNFPVDRLFRSYADIFDAFVRATAAWSAEEQAAFFSGTALRVYRLSGLPTPQISQFTKAVS